jgi:hypothetical protein
MTYPTLWSHLQSSSRLSRHYISFQLALLNYSTKQSPSWEANRFSASQEIPSISWSPKVRYPFTSPVTCPCPEPDQSSPCPPFHFLKIHLNINILSTTGPSKWTLFVRFPHPNPVYTSPIPHTPYMPLPPHYSLFNRVNSIWWGVHIIKLFTV